MRIKHFCYENKALGWKTGTIELNGFNLLVGASGVGKTRLLKALKELREIALGAAVDGVTWELLFEHDQQEIAWSGSFSFSGRIPEKGPVLVADSPNKAELELEKLSLNSLELVSRQGSTIVFKGEKLPVKLSASSSVISLLSEDEVIGTLFKAFKNKITFASVEPKSDFQSYFPFILPRFTTLEAIRESQLDGLTRLAIAYSNQRPIFEQIIDDFRSVFPTVLEVEVHCEPRPRATFKLIEYIGPQKSDLVLYVKELGVENWIRHDQLSSGMWKTLLLLIDHYLCADNSVILVDEIENSLGVNCIDILGDLMGSARGLQYVITSHHPYIINKVPISCWRIIARENGRVVAKTPADYGLGNSKHEAFMQLLQLDVFTSGVASV